MDDKTEYTNALKWRLRALQEEIENERHNVRGLLQIIEGKEEQAKTIIRLLEAEGANLDAEFVDGFHLMSVADMAYEVLANLDDESPVHYRELAEMIMAEGKLIPGQDPAANLIAHLSRDDRFVRTDRGTYGLAEWGIESSPKPRIRRRRRRR